MADLLSWAHNERRSGSLVVRRTSRAKRVFFEDGLVVGCLSDNPYEFYGQHLLNNGYLDEATLLSGLTRCREEHKRLGQVLAEQGILSEEVIRETLRRQVEERVCDLFLWRSGVFFFEAEEAPEEERLSERLDTMALILDGARWADEMRRLAEILPHDDVVLERGRIWPGENLIPLAAKLAGLIDGERSLGKIYEVVKGSYFLYLNAAYGVVKAGIAEVQDPGSSLGTGSIELNLYDLMFEQAAEEQVLTSDRHVAIPMNVLESYVPIWTEGPSEEEWERMPVPVRSFYQAIDGQRRLGDLLAEGKERRQREVELLLLQMRRSRVALLPDSLLELERNARLQGIRDAVDGNAPAKAGSGKAKGGAWWKKIF